MTVNNHEPGLHIVTRLVAVSAGESYDPPLLWLRCEGAGGTVTVIAAADNDAAAQTFALAAQGELRKVAIRKVTAATATGLIGGR